jgi:hypothetical protein
MDIGEEGEPYVIEPVQEPVPGRERTAPPEPDFAPVEPRREREPVPA